MGKSTNPFDEFKRSSAPLLTDGLLIKNETVNRLEFSNDKDVKISAFLAKDKSLATVLVFNFCIIEENEWKRGEEVFNPRDFINNYERTKITYDGIQREMNEAYTKVYEMVNISINFDDGFVTDHYHFPSLDEL